MGSNAVELLRRHRLVGCSLVMMVAACGVAPEPELQPGTGAIAGLLGTSGAAADGAGYIHLASASKFHVGSAATNLSELGFSKVVGSDGVFATAANGWVGAFPVAGAASTMVDPLTRVPEVHNQTVVSYFVGAGLPTAQIGNVTAHADARGSGTGKTSGPLPNGTFAGYTSVLARVVAGIPVPDSFAWAQFNANGEVVKEAVYWPAIPQSVIQEAQALNAKLSDPTQRATYMSKLPAGLVNGQVVIRHSSCSERSTFEVFAGYDLTERREMGGVRHFDMNGTEFKMKSEAHPGPQTPRKR